MTAHSSEKRLVTALGRTAICALSGTLLFLACADFDIWPLAWVGIVPLLAVVLDRRCEHPFFYGWVTGLLANGGGFYWINGLLMRFGHLPFIAAVPIFFLLVGYQALAFGAFAWTVRRLRERIDLPMTLLAPVTMTAIELLMPFVFPWYLAITQAWVRPVIQIADLTGPLGVSFLLVLSNGALYDALSAWRERGASSMGTWASAATRPLLAAGLTIAAALVYGQVRIHQVEAERAKAPKIQVGVVQANIGINEKFVPGLADEQLRVHQRLSADLERRGADLIVWPESSYPYPIQRERHNDYTDGDPRQVMRGFHTPLLFGALTLGEGSPYPFNTALMMNSQGTLTGRFDKNFLLVFGEYVPLYDHIKKYIREYIPEASNFARGTTVTTFPFAPPHERGSDGSAGYRLGPMICYEDIIPAFGRRLVAQHPNLLVNITNDAWFGDTSEPWEHLALAVFRAVEHRLDLVRAVNTGVSALVDATGRVYAKSPAVDPGMVPPGLPPPPPQTLLGEAAMLDAGGVYQMVGELFGELNLMLLCALGVVARKRAGRPIAWRAVAGGAALLWVGLLAGALVLCGPSSLGLAVDLLLHRAHEATDQSFDVGLRLIAAGGVAALVVGAVLPKLAGPKLVGKRGAACTPKLEGLLAALGALVVPALLVGRIEGDTAGLVFSGLGAMALVLVGLRLVTRNAPARQAPPEQRSDRSR